MLSLLTAMNNGSHDDTQSEADMGAYTDDDAAAADGADDDGEVHATTPAIRRLLMTAIRRLQ